MMKGGKGEAETVIADTYACIPKPANANLEAFVWHLFIISSRLSPAFFTLTWE